MRCCECKSHERRVFSANWKLEIALHIAGITSTLTALTRNPLYQYKQYQFLNSSDEETLDKLFKEVDKDGNDELSNDEVGQLCMMFGQTVSEEEINLAIKTADADGDGKVNVDEFKAEILSTLVCSLRNTTKFS